MRVKIRLDTLKDAQRFAEIAESCEGWVHITDANGMCVNLSLIHISEPTRH